MIYLIIILINITMTHPNIVYTPWQRITQGKEILALSQALSLQSTVSLFHLFLTASRVVYDAS